MCVAPPTWDHRPQTGGSPETAPPLESSESPHKQKGLVWLILNYLEGRLGAGSKKKKRGGVSPTSL